MRALFVALTILLTPLTTIASIDITVEEIRLYKADDVFPEIVNRYDCTVNSFITDYRNADSFEAAKSITQEHSQALWKTATKDLQQTPKLDVAEFKNNLDKYTIVDIRNQSETEEGLFFDNAHTIPLHKLRENASNLPSEKPIVVHCAGGYRSAAGSSILENQFPNSTVFDLSDAVTEFKK